jgi:hypothetical protein
MNLTVAQLVKQFASAYDSTLLNNLMENSPLLEADSCPTGNNSRRFMTPMSNFVDNIPSREADSCSAGQRIRILLSPSAVHYRVYKIPPLDSILS